MFNTIIRCVELFVLFYTFGQVIGWHHVRSITEDIAAPFLSIMEAFDLSGRDIATHPITLVIIGLWLLRRLTGR